MREVKVSDLALAAFLAAQDYPLVKLAGSNGRREFVFRDVPDSAIFGFYSGEKVSAQRLLDSYKSLKGLLLQNV